MHPTRDGIVPSQRVGAICLVWSPSSDLSGLPLLSPSCLAGVFSTTLRMPLSYLSVCPSVCPSVCLPVLVLTLSLCWLDRPIVLGFSPACRLSCRAWPCIISALVHVPVPVSGTGLSAFDLCLLSGLACLIPVALSSLGYLPCLLSPVCCRSLLSLSVPLHLHHPRQQRKNAELRQDCQPSPAEAVLLR